MKSRVSRFRVELAVLIVVLTASSGCQSLGKRPVSNRIDQAVEAEMNRQNAVGVAVGVIRDGRIAHLKGYGLANRKSETPVDTESMFRWASISKPLTALAAMQLWEEGKLDLDADRGKTRPGPCRRARGDRRRGSEHRLHSPQ